VSFKLMLSIDKQDCSPSLFYTNGRSEAEKQKTNKQKQSWKAATLQRWLCWTGSHGAVFSVSQSQRISSRCGAVKSVLCPRRLVTVERPPAIGVFVCAPPVPERSHPAPPPPLVSAPSAPRSASATRPAPAGRITRRPAESPGRRGPRLLGGERLRQLLAPGATVME
jgi:hypothetical protein